ncbi:MAG: InlB B-repeat-containing protein [Clostridia bacterium]|nr:InlB B-repeat-containing protein [Clostridia bacterium]
MRKILKIFLIVMCVIVSLGAITKLSGLTKILDEPGEKYRITYRAVIFDDGADTVTETTIDPRFFIDDEKYPTFYFSNQGTNVGDLKDYINLTETKDLEFVGWYYDAACTRKCSGGRIPKKTEGNVTLYAKLSVAYWTLIY